MSAFHVSTGAKAWTTPLDSTVDGYAPFETILADSSRQILLVMDVSGSLYRIDPATGARIWTSTPGFGPMIGLSTDSVTLQLTDRQIDLDLETGQTTS